MRYGAILILCLQLMACDRKPAETAVVHIAATMSPCVADWTKCADNAQLVHDYAEWKKVPALCQQVTSDQSQSGTPQWSGKPFSAFLPGTIYVTSGKAVALAPDVAFFSHDVVVHAKVVCEYDLNQHAVTSLYIVPL